MGLPEWRDLAVVLLALEAFVLGLIPAIVLFFAVRGMLWVIRKLRAVFPTIRGYFGRAAGISQRASHKIAAPVIAASAAAYQVRRWRTYASSLIRQPREV
jgi:hypothetical protein